MQKYLLSVIFRALGSAQAFGMQCALQTKVFCDQPTVMLGICCNFGGGLSAQTFGVLPKVRSNGLQDYQAAALRVTALVCPACGA